MTLVRYWYAYAALLAVCLMPASAHAATLFVVPSSAEITVGSTILVAVMVDSEGVAINNAEGTLTIPTDLFEIVSVNQSPSIFTLWIQSPASTGSDVSFNGGLPSPGYTGTQGRLFSVTLRAKAAGSGAISLLGAAVRANDGLGTDVLRSTGASYITVVGAPTKTTEPATTAPAPATIPAASTPAASGALVVSSPTHPSQDAWYPINAPLIQWTLPQGADSVQTLVGKNKGTTPIVTYKPAIAKKQLDALDDGVWYFNIRAHTARGWSEVYSYKVQIDTVAPTLEDTTIVYSDGSLHVAALADDERSGIKSAQLWLDGTYMADVDAAKLESGASVALNTGAGEHTATLRVADAAGNTTVSEGTTFVVEAMPNPLSGVVDALTSFNWSSLMPWALPLSVLSLLMNLWLWMRLRRQERRAGKSSSRGGDKFQKVAKQKLTTVKKDIQKQLKDLERADKRPDITPADAAHIKKVQTHLKDAQKYIEQKIEEVEKS